MSAPPPPRRLRRPNAVGRWLGRVVSRGLLVTFLLVLAAFFLLVGWLQSNDFQVRALRVVEAAAERALGEQVTLGRIRVRFWAPGVDLEGVHVFHGPTGDTIVSAERVRVPLAVRDGRLAIGQLQVQAPNVHLHLDADGKIREFRGAPRSGKGLQQLPFSWLRVTDGDLRIDHAEGFVAIDGFTVQPMAGGLADVSGTLTFRARGFEDGAAFTWPGVEITPDVIAVPALALDTRAADVTGAIRWEIGDAVAGDVSARITLDAFTPLLTPPRALHGGLELTVHVDGPPHDPTFTMNATGTRLGVDLPGVFTPLLTYELGDGTASIVVHGDTVSLEEIVFLWGPRGRIVAWGTIDTATRRLHGGHVTADTLDLEPVLRAFDVAPTPFVDLVGQAEVAWEGTLDPLHLEGTFDVTADDLRVGDRPIRDPAVVPLLVIPHAHTAGRIVLEKDHVHLEAPSVEAPRSRGSAVVDIGFGPRGPLDLRADLFAADLRDFAPLGEVGLKGQGRLAGTISGPFNKLEFDGQADVTGFEVLKIPYADHLVARVRSPDMKSLVLEDAVATFGESRYHGRYGIDFRSPLSMTTDITIDGGRVEDLVHMFVDLDGITGRMSGGRLQLDGPLLDLSGEAHVRFADVNLYGETFPVGEGHGFMDTGVFTLDDLRVRRDEGRAGLTLRGTVDRAWRLDMELLADGLTLEGLDHLTRYDLPLTGRIAGHARLTNTLFDPSPDGRIVLSEVRYARELAEDSVITFDSRDGVAHVTGSLLGGTGTASGTLGLWGVQPYTFEVALDELPAHLLHPTAADGSAIAALVSGEVDLSGHFGRTWSPVTLRADLARVSVVWDHHTLTNQHPWTVEQDGRSWRLSDVGLAGGATDVLLDTATGGDAIDLAGRGTLDLDLLRAVVPGLTRADGTAEVTFEVRGVRPDVEVVVAVEVEADLLRHHSAPLTFEDATASIEIRSDRIDVVSAQGGLGGGLWTASGHVDTRSFVPVRYDLALEVTDAQVQWIETLPPAIGDGTFHFDGPTGALLLWSDGITIDDMTFSDRIDWEDWVVVLEEEMLVDAAAADDAAPLFSLRIPIRADHTIHLVNNVAEGTASADLTIIGDTARPGLVGTVTIDEGQVFLQDREFRVDRGMLVFDDPWSWDPLLDFSLLTDIDNQDQRYRVNYQVGGPFSDWNAVARSDPPLPPADVNALLWFGMTMDDLEAQGELSSALGLGMVDLFVTDWFLSGQAPDLGLGQDFPDLLTPDRIDLATGVDARGEYSPDPRLLVEKRLHDFGEVDLQWEFNLVRAEDSIVTLSRRFGRRLSLAGWYSSLQRERVLPIGGAYGLDMSARWEFE